MDPLSVLLVGSGIFTLLWFGLRAGTQSGWFGLRARSDSSAGRRAPRQPDAGAQDFQYQQRLRKEQFRQQLDARLGAPQSGDALDYQILEAQRLAPLLRKLVREELPRTIRHCVTTHRLAAVAAGAEFIYEIALEPECFALRERVVSIVAEAIERLEKYPLLIEDVILMQNLIVLRGRILPTCRDCPYLRYGTYYAPLLCPSAEYAGLKPKEADHDENAE